MDQLDKQILLALSKNCRISYSKLAREFYVSVNTIKNRINSLVEIGIIQGFAVMLNPKLFQANRAVAVFKTKNYLEKKLSNVIGSHPNIDAVSQGLDAGFVTILYRTNEALTTVSDFLQDRLQGEYLDVYPILIPVQAQATQLEPIKTVKDIQPVDWLILWHLRNKGRMTLSDVSKKVGMSVSSIRRRLQFLRSNHLIEETILLNPGVLESGMMVIYKLDLPQLTTKKRHEIDKMLRTHFTEFWVSWHVVGRPILLLGFQAANSTQVLEFEQQLQSELLPETQSIEHFVGGAMEYYSDFRDELLEEKREHGWFSKQQWKRDTE